ncbi:MAG: glycosidase [Actinomycetia bacterium]|nr:glycosidase [Actinomycetes bacterium]
MIAGLAARSPLRLRADSSRVITQLFVPGQEGFDHLESRTSPVLQRLLALDEDEVRRTYDAVVGRFTTRHRDLADTFGRHADELAERLPAGLKLSPTHWLLLGATFTSEYAIEGAALCNPSIVAHPDQAEVPAGHLRFALSVRGIGEGHRSTIGFRTGMVDESGIATLDGPPRYATTGATSPARLDASVFRTELRRLEGPGENADYVFDALGERFSSDDLEAQLTRLQDQRATRRRGSHTIAHIRAIAERTYGVCFPELTSLAERVLRPAMAAERQGMEDARFVRFTEDDGTVAYYATYTAYDGDGISQQLLQTTDFRTFTSSPIVGPAAANKGLALFPRRIDGRFVALSRADRETNAVAFSDDLRVWGTASPCQAPARPWELLQLGNCGSPIETEAGWLVLTHGVGPMRTYSIGAILLDLDDPTKVLGNLAEPLLQPTPDEQDGYVPNVVYSCGALVHAGTLVLPYGIGDAAIGMATVPMAELLGALAG